MSLENVTRVDGDCGQCKFWVQSMLMATGEVVITDSTGRHDRKVFPGAEGVVMERLLSNIVHFSLRAHRKRTH